MTRLPLTAFDLIRARFRAALTRRPRPSPARRRLAVEPLEGRWLPSTYMVTNTLDAGAGSLRQAILDSNANPGADLICFAMTPADPNHVYYTNDGVAGQVTPANITVTSAANDSTITDLDPDHPHSWWSIKPTSMLPRITGVTTIDGYTQAGSSVNTLLGGLNTVLRIELNGSQAGATASTVGLLFDASDSTVRGLSINSFYGAQVLAGQFNQSVHFSAEGNFIGVDPSGTRAGTEQGLGVSIFVQSNGRIGTDANGVNDPAERNLVSGGTVGINLRGGSGYVVAGNLVGTDITGTRAIPNISNGINVHHEDFVLGGTSEVARNVVSGNHGFGGISITNVGNGTPGKVQGNFVGVDVSGVRALGNRGYGISAGATGSTTTETILIGGTVAGARNIVSANSGAGIIVGNGGTALAGATVQGNYIGTDLTGMVDLGNGGSGVFAYGPGNRVGGSDPGAGNLISGNGGNGIQIGDGSRIGTNTIVQGNYVGTNASGTAALRNDNYGIRILTGSFNTIGGTSVGARNLVSGNVFDGINVQGTYNSADFRSVGNEIVGNYVGTNAAGTAALPNGAVGDGYGINVGGGSGNRVAGNLVSGNGDGGIALGDWNSVVQGNKVGTDATGTLALPNTGNLNFPQFGNGIYVSGVGNTIGGVNPGEGNLVAFNSGAGVLVTATSGFLANSSVAIRGNSIHSNGGLGIDLAPFLSGARGVTGNDALDADAGPNGYQNFPLLAAATSGHGVTTVKGTLNSTAGATYTIDFYSSAAADPSGHGEGQTFLGSTTVTADASGNASFTAAYALAVPEGHFVTATATAADGSTSEFSARAAVTHPCVINTNDSGPGSLRQAMLDANLSVGIVETICFNIPTTDPGYNPATGAFTIRPLSQLPVISDAVKIDGTTQPGFAGTPVIELDGSLAGAADGLRVAAAGNTVRGLVINRFAQDGIDIQPGGNNVIVGNYVGTDVTGTLDRGNGSHGIAIQDAPNNVIGGTTAADRNVISGNGVRGVYVVGATSAGIVVQGNYIGLNAAGTAGIGNSGHAVWIEGASATIGGTGPGARNVIATNGGGVVISGPGASGSQVVGNYIGTNALGSVALGNGANGVDLPNSPTNVAIRGNVIARTANGIALGGANNTATGNYIGTDPTGTLDFGVLLNGINNIGVNNTIGGTAAGAGNVISGNAGHGIRIAPAATGTVVQGNYIGVNAAGTGDLGNDASGIAIESNNNLIDNNLISGNQVSGVLISTNTAGATASGNLVQNNRIGTDASGTADLGNTRFGIDISRAGNNTVRGNLIGGNDDYGIVVDGSGNPAGFPLTTGNVIVGNFVGTNATGSALGNVGGIRVTGGASNTTIGGTASGDANVIANNTNAGVVVTGIGGGNSIRGNSIAHNNGLGIDLGGDGVTANDAADADAGPNGLQNFPVLASAQNNGASTTVTGTINSTPLTALTLDFYANMVADPSGHGEGRTYLGAGTITTDANGDGAFTLTFAVAVPVGQFVSATATSADGTSEFSANGTVASPNRPPDARDDERSTAAYTPATINVLGNDSDPDGNPLTIIVVGAAGHGTVVPGLPGDLVYTPAPGFVGDDSFTYTISDGQGGTDTATVTVHVLAASTSVVISVPGVTYGSDGSVTVTVTSPAGPVTGDVTLTVGAGAPLTHALVGGSWTFVLPGLTAGDYPFAVSFGPQNGFAGGATTGTLHVDPAPTGTALTVSDPAPLYGSDGVTLTATVSSPASGAGTPGGVVRFYDGATLLGTGTLTGGTATLTLGPAVLAPGAHTIRAEYVGGGNYGGSVGTATVTPVAPASLQGLVYVDFNDDGAVNFNEKAVAGATVTLTGHDDRGTPVNRTAVTDANGVYVFTGLRPSGSAGYTLTESQPAGLLDGKESVGLVNGIATGAAPANDTFSGIVLHGTSVGENYNFGERPTATGGVVRGLTATIGYWQNKNGQDLIKSVNGGPAATQLGSWLAATFPNLYAHLAGKTNAEVAAFYKTLFARTAHTAPAGPPKVDAQVMAVALGVYVTNQNLAGSVAAGYGFSVSDTGLGTRAFNVGSNGAAFGRANNTSVTVLDLLLEVNARSKNGLLLDADGNGQLSGTEVSHRTMANDVFSAINEAGDI